MGVPTTIPALFLPLTNIYIFKTAKPKKATQMHGDSVVTSIESVFCYISALHSKSAKVHTASII